MTVGERIKKLRIEKGLSQEELAKRAGYADKTAICKIERSGDDVSTYIINKMANALGVDSTEGGDCGQNQIILTYKNNPRCMADTGDL